MSDEEAAAVETKKEAEAGAGKSGAAKGATGAATPSGGADPGGNGGGAPPGSGAGSPFGYDPRVTPRPIEDELKHSFLDYSMSVIVSRALPDVRDGLKPVHRRILYGMRDLGLTHDKPYKKSARVVGEVLGKYHPHGDTAVYDSMVRMAQTFSLRYPLIDGQGNFGSVDGDGAAAMRYTEARMGRLASEMLADIEKETVDWTDNFDASLEEPTVLPAKLPNLLVNGSSGIAVGMATNVPPHNLNEIADGLVKLIENPEVTIQELMESVQGPDFPTGGIIHGRTGIGQAYATGRGKVVVRGKAEIVDHGDRQRILISEIPYMVNKSTLLTSMAELVKEKRIEGISDLRDESDRTGMRIVVELKRSAMADVVLNQLYAHTQLQSTFGILNLALVENRPRVLNLKQTLEHFLAHRVVVVTRRTEYDLRKAQEKLHVLEGLLIALENIEEVIALIRASKTTEDARNGLMARFELSEVQAKAILDMRLAKLAALEVEAVKNDHADTLKLIERLKEILGSRAEVLAIIKAEVEELRKNYGDERRTQIVESELDVEVEDLIPDEPVVIMATAAGYIKRVPVTEYRTQGRGGRGLIGMETKEDDAVVDVFLTRTHSYILFVTNRGQLHWLKAYRVPEGGRYSRGKAIVNLLSGLEPGEKVQAAIPVREFRDDQYLFFATKQGTVKKTVLSAYSNVRVTGIRAVTLDEGDELVGVALSSGKDDIVLAKAGGKAIRFHETEVRPMGRTATGVRGVGLEKDDAVVSLVVVRGDGDLLTVKANGKGKRTPLEDYPVKHRGTGGQITIKTEDAPVVAMMQVAGEDEILATTARGIILRTSATAIPQKGRIAQGNWIIRPEEGDQVRALAKLSPEVLEEAAREAEAEPTKLLGKLLPKAPAGANPNGDSGTGLVEAQAELEEAEGQDE